MANRAYVLVIEDEEELRTEIAAYLQRRGYEVRQAASAQAGREALDALKTDGPAVLVVLCDENLPDGDGLGLFSDFAPAMPGSHWVLMSGDHDGSRLAVAASSPSERPLPSYTLLEKPFTLRSLKNAIERQTSNGP